MVETKKAHLKVLYKDGHPDRVEAEVDIGGDRVLVECEVDTMGDSEQALLNSVGFTGHSPANLSSSELTKLVAAVEFAAEWVESQGYAFRGPPVESNSA